MATITVRDLPDQTKEKLRVRAAQSGVSLEAYVRHLLNAASDAHDAKPINIMELAGKHFGRHGGIELELPSRASHRPTVDFK